jgi:hypothetical protein
LCIGISFGFRGVFRRHHRSPTSAIEPAGQDPGTRLSTGTGYTSALFARKSQSFPDNVIAGFGPAIIRRSNIVMILRTPTAVRKSPFPLLAQSGHDEERNRCRFRGSGHGLLQCTCLLLTQHGHQMARFWRGITRPSRSQRALNCYGKGIGHDNRINYSSSRIP